MTEAMQLLVSAAEDFVAKCERGEARSVRSYSRFKEALAAIEAERQAKRHNPKNCPSGFIGCQNCE